MKKLFILGVLLAAVLVPLFASGSKESSAPAGSTSQTVKPVTLEYWTVYEADSALLTIMKKAASELPDVNLKIVSKGDAGFRDLMTAAAMAQSGPDLSFDWTGLADMITRGREGLYLPLNKSGYFTKEELGKLRLLQSVTDPKNGDVYGTAIGDNYIALAYNKQMMKKAGIDYNNFPPKWTYQQFLDVCKKLKEAGITPFGFANKNGTMAVWWHSFSFPSYMNKITDVIPYYNSAPIYNPVFKEFAAKWKAMYDAGYFLKGGNTIETNDLWGQFTSKKVAMIPVFPALYSIYIKALGQDNVGLIEWPSMGGHGKLAMDDPIFGDAIGITAWTKYAKQGSEFIKKLVFDKAIAQDFIQQGLFPVDKDFQISDFTISNPTLKQFAVNFGKIPTYPEGHAFWTAAYSAAIQKYSNAFLEGQITAKQYADEIQQAITK